MQQRIPYQFQSGLHCLLKDALKPRVQSICSIRGTRYLSKHWIREYGTQDRGNTFLYDSHQLTTSKHHFCVFLFKDPLLDWKYNSSVGHLPSMYEALHSIPSATHNKQIHQCHYLLHIVNSQHITLIPASENLIWHITAPWTQDPKQHFSTMLAANFKQRNHQQKAQKCKTQGTEWTPERILACGQNTALSDLQCVLRGTHIVLQMNLQKNWFRVSDKFKHVSKFKYRICNNEDSVPFPLPKSST